MYIGRYRLPRASGIVLAMLALGIVLGPSHTAAFEPLDGCFVATEACLAKRSIRSHDPNAPTLEPGKGYPLQGANKRNATHFQIEFGTPNSQQLWVAIDCGKRTAQCERSGQAAAPKTSPINLLAVTWHPAFCETSGHRPECTDLEPGDLDATHFSLHGLWPQPRDREYCGVPSTFRALDENGDWQALPEPRLSDATHRQLQEVMPGTRSFLDRHEWIKHGMCFGADAERYFKAAISLLSQLNSSDVRQVFENAIGDTLSAETVRAAFDRSFGDGAGDRIVLSCRDGNIVELRLSILGDAETQSLGELLLAARPSTGSGCRRGEVDAAGD